MPRRTPRTMLSNDPLWYKDAIIYEVHVRAFYDSSGDGIGDFCGLTEKLDYLQDLGVTAIWLLPFYPSPLRDDGYDIANYTGVHRAYGTLHDFKNFLWEAHRRGIRVITELVLNHTSDQHPWFQRARQAKPGSSWRNFYVWSDNPERYQEARIIFKDFEVSNWRWDPEVGAYYWHRFYSHQPDLNYDNPQVRRAVFQVMDFWLRLGVDGLRLDAVPYLFEREGTPGENLPQTHAFLKQMRHHIDARFQNRMVLAEANQWPEDAVAYFGAGDECHMAFHFPLMPRLFMALRQEDRYPIIDIMAQTPEIDPAAQWALFLRNHDELTLEMVTDEERAYMYQVYARSPEAQINLGIRRRLAPLLENNRRRIELLNGLLFSMPGTPVIYYGDEIGMGDNIYLGDRNGVRTPMQWNANRNAGFSPANPQQLYLPLIVDPEYHHASINVEAQQQNPSSLYNWMKRLIALRKRYQAFGRGNLEFLHPANRKVLAFLRCYDDQYILVVANLSRFTQYVELELQAFQGTTPIEIFGRTPFPPIGELPYLLTLAPHTFQWFALERVPATAEIDSAPPSNAALPQIRVMHDWAEIVAGNARTTFEDILPGYLQQQRWFGSKARRLLSYHIVEALPIAYDGATAYVALVRTAYADGDPETYVVPLAYATGRHAEELHAAAPSMLLAEIQVTDNAQASGGVVYDALCEAEFRATLFEIIAHNRRLHGQSGTMIGTPTSALRQVRRGHPVIRQSSLVEAEQSNTSILYGDRWIFKLFRRIEVGANPEREIGQYLTDHGFTHSPSIDGMLLYQQQGGQSSDLGIVHQFVPNQGNAWDYTLEALQQFFTAVQEQPHTAPLAGLSTQALLELNGHDLPPAIAQLLGNYAAWAEQLGQSTARLHHTLASAQRPAAFRPEPITAFYQRSLYQSMRSMTGQTLRQLRAVQLDLPPEVQANIQFILDREEQLMTAFQAVRSRPLSGVRMRCHGNYHLGQVLVAQQDWMIIDFEGEPAKPLYKRQLKQPPLVDIAGMLQSWYAAVVVVIHQPGMQQSVLEAWGRYWYAWIGSRFLHHYLAVAEPLDFLPRTRREIHLLLDVLRLERAVYELGYELNSRPDQVYTPLYRLRQILEETAIAVAHE